MDLKALVKHNIDISEQNQYPITPPEIQGRLIRGLGASVEYADTMEFASNLNLLGMLNSDVISPFVHFAGISNLAGDTDNAFMVKQSEEGRRVGQEIGAKIFDVNADTLPALLAGLDNGKRFYAALANVRDSLAAYKQTGVFPSDLLEVAVLPKGEMPEDVNPSRAWKLKTAIAGKMVGKMVKLADRNVFALLSNDSAEHMLQTSAHSTYEVQLKIDRVLTTSAAQVLVDLVGTQIDKRNNTRKATTDFREKRQANRAANHDDPGTKLANAQTNEAIIWNKVDQLLQKARPATEQETSSLDILRTLSDVRTTWHAEVTAREVHFATIIDEERVHKLQRFGRLLMDGALSADLQAQLDAAEASKPAPEKAEKLELDPQLLQQCELLLVKHGALVEPYRTSRNQLKKFGLASFDKDLRQTIDTNLSYRIAAACKGLQDELLVTDVELMKVQLEATLQDEAKIQADLQSIAEQIRSFDKKITLGSISRLANDIAWMQDNWAVVEPALNAHWPKQPELFAEQLKQLLGIESPALQITFTETPTPFVENAVVDLLPEAIPLSLDEQLFNKAEQLDFVAFPAGPHRYEALKTDVQQFVKAENVDDVELWRIRLLDEIATEKNGKLYRTLPKGFGTEMPWYVVHFNVEGTDSSIAIVENPVYGNATYVIKNEYADFWKELIENFNRKEAQQLHAQQLLHPDREVLGRFQAHKLRLGHKITDMMTAKGFKI